MIAHNRRVAVKTGISVADAIRRSEAVANVSDAHPRANTRDAAAESNARGASCRCRYSPTGRAIGNAPCERDE